MMTEGAPAHGRCHCFQLCHVAQDVETRIFLTGNEQRGPSEVDTGLRPLHHFCEELTSVGLVGQVIHPRTPMTPSWPARGKATGHQCPSLTSPRARMPGGTGPPMGMHPDTAY